MAWWNFRKTASPSDARRAVVTFIFGGYDTLKDPTVVTPGWDYLCYGDTGLRSAVWRSVVPAASLQDVPCPKRRASLLKIAHHRHVAGNYETVITIDGSMRINCNLDDFLAEFHHGDHDLTLARHPDRDCLYDEADAVLEYGFDDPDVVRRQVARYRAAGFPRKQGLYGTRMMVKSHRSAGLRAMGDLWADEYRAGSRRDQLSLTYAIWRHARQTGRPLRIGAFDFDEVYRRRRLFEITPHLGSQRWQ